MPQKDFYSAVSAIVKFIEAAEADSAVTPKNIVPTKIMPGYGQLRRDVLNIKANKQTERK